MIDLSGAATRRNPTRSVTQVKKAPRGYKTPCDAMRPVASPSRFLPPAHNLHGHIADGAGAPQRDQTPAHPPVHPPASQGHDDEQPRKRDQQGDATDQQRSAHLDLIRLIPYRSTGMLLVSSLAALDRQIQSAEADAEEDVQHGTAEAGAQRHDRIAEPRDRDIGDEVAQGVTDGEDGESEDGVADAQDDAEGFEDADDFVGDGGDPGDGDDESEEAEQVAVFGRTGRRGGED